MLESLPTDGIFFDIVGVLPCACRHCRAGMVAQGKNPASLADRQAYGQQMIDEFKRDMTAFVRQFNADCTIFYNAGHIGTRDRPRPAPIPTGSWRACRAAAGATCTSRSPSAMRARWGQIAWA